MLACFSSYGSLMKLGMCTGTCSNVLIMHIIFFLPVHKKCGFYGNGNSQNIAKTWIPR